MAINGIHIVCGFTGGIGYAGNVQGGLPTPVAGVTLIGNAVWSETQANPATTTHSAPAMGQPIFEVYAGVDSYVAIGPAPDAVNGPRFYVPALTITDFLGKPGDKLAWTTA